MPLRVPPPKAETPMEQFIIDSLMHLDECVDDAKKELKRLAEDWKEERNNFKAEISAIALSKEEAHVTLLERIASHEREHQLIDTARQARKSVWILQGKWLEKSINILSTGLALTIAAAILKFVGLL